MEDDVLVQVNSEADIVTARQKGRELAVRIGFSPTDRALIATVISELARNILHYAGHGQVFLRCVQGDENQAGVLVVAHDEGPGIADVARALEVRYSTSRGAGLGLPGVKRVMDEFEIASEVGRGTTVAVKKWRK